MKLVKLGQSDLQVSDVGLGVMTFGAQTDEHAAYQQLDRAFEAGITLFDTAENYPAPVDPKTQGLSEIFLGRWLATRGLRDRVIVATKVAGPGNAPGDMTHIRGEARRLDRANISMAVDDSLRRLQTDYIDVYQVHWPERPITTLRRARYSHLPDQSGNVPIEETLSALDEQVRAGKVRHIGVCNESPWGLMQYLTHAAQDSLPRVVSLQQSYSLLDRHLESGLAEILMQERVGLLGYSPLASGLLTGKYDSGKVLAETRSSLFPGFERRFATPVRDAVRAYSALAQELGVPLAALALAFARQQPFMSSVLMAARTTAQLQDNLAALDVVLSQEVLSMINAIHDRQPNPA